MAEQERSRGRRGDDAVYFDHAGTPCKDTRYHRQCSGRWRGEVSLGKDGAGRRVRRKVSARTKSQVYDKLDDVRKELAQGVRTSSTYTVQDACDDWLDSMGDKSAKTRSTNKEMLDPLLTEIGQRVLRDLEADHVIMGLKIIAETRSTRTVRDTRATLVRAITYAQARRKLSRNVASLIKAPPGKAPGGPSRALTLAQAIKVLAAAAEDRIYAYVVLSLLVGVRTEESRALGSRRPRRRPGRRPSGAAARERVALCASARAAQCFLDRTHLENDSDHRDKHGCTAPVLVHQSTIREVEALQQRGELVPQRFQQPRWYRSHG
jgi:hypothetical protein